MQSIICEYKATQPELRARLVPSRAVSGNPSDSAPKASTMLDTLDKARSHMALALEILDGVDAPADIGAHLDLAVHRLDATVADLRRSEGQNVWPDSSKQPPNPF